MARVGINPARSKLSTYRPAQVTVAVLTHIPELEGYYRHRLDVLKLCLNSILAHTEKPYDLMVFDNGSCAPVVDYLRQMRDAGAIDYMLFSTRNLGKIGALQVMFNAAPGEWIAYCDDDILFYPGWLPAHMQIIETYPNVGMVSGLPVRNLSERSSTSLHTWVASQPDHLDVNHTRHIPDEWEMDWALSTGRDAQEHLKATLQNQDMVLRYHTVGAFGSANHFQFLSPRLALLNAMPDQWTGKLMGHMTELDDAIDQQGLLRLSTLERYTRHIGNVILHELAQEASSLGLDASRATFTIAEKKHWLLRIPGMGRFFRKLYGWLFDVLHGVR